jgi:hypothetical protein
MLAKPTPRQLGAAVVCSLGALASVGVGSNWSLRHALRWDSPHWLLLGCGALFLVSRLEAQVITRAILGFTALLMLAVTHPSGFSSMQVVMLFGSAGALGVASSDGLRDDLRGAFRPRAHRGRLLVAAAVAAVTGGLVGLFGVHFLDQAARYGWYFGSRFPGPALRFLVLGTGFGASALAIVAGFFALLRLRTFGLALVFAGDTLALALALRGHAWVKPILATILVTGSLAQVALLWPFLVGAARHMTRSRDASQPLHCVATPRDV